MTLSVELDQVLNFALGTPEVGAVNFNILHGLLHVILKHLGIDKRVTEISDDGAFRSAYAILKNRGVGEQVKDSLNEEKTAGDSAKETHSAVENNQFALPQSLPSWHLESKVSKIEKRLELLDDLPSNAEILQRVKQKKDGKTPVADLWQNINMNRRLGATEQGIEKVCGVTLKRARVLCVGLV